MPRHFGIASSALLLLLAGTSPSALAQAPWNWARDFSSAEQHALHPLIQTMLHEARVAKPVHGRPQTAKRAM